MEYLKAFLCGGFLCLIGQVLIDRTQLTPARILTGYVVAGVFLSAVGLYQPLVDWGGAGASPSGRGCGRGEGVGSSSPPPGPCCPPPPLFRGRASRPSATRL